MLPKRGIYWTYVWELQDLTIVKLGNFVAQNHVQGVPHLSGFHYRGSHYCNFWLMYMQVGDFHVSGGPQKVPLIQISHNARTLCKSKPSELCIFLITILQLHNHSCSTLQQCRAVHILIVDKLHISNHFGWKLEWHGVQKVIKKWFSNAAMHGHSESIPYFE